MGRTAAGVRGITLADENDEVVGMISVHDLDSDVFVVSEKGYGKRSKVQDYRLTNRGGKGVKTINITDKTGKLVAIKNVKDGDDLMIITKNGLTIRFAVDDIRQMGRAAQGVRAIHLREGDEIASVAKIAREDEMENVNGAENQQNNENGTSIDVNEKEQSNENQSNNE